MTYKRCFICGLEQPIDNFYTHNQMADGHLNKCKECTRKGATAYRNKNLERIREYDKKRGCRMTAEDVRSYRKRNPEKYKAHNALRNAMRNGKLERPTSCSTLGCDGRPPYHGHHSDYSKPLEVTWLCAACHHRGEHTCTQSDRSFSSAA